MSLVDAFEEAAALGKERAGEDPVVGTPRRSRRLNGTSSPLRERSASARSNVQQTRPTYQTLKNFADSPNASAIPYYCGFVFPLLAIATAHQGGWYTYSALGLAFVFLPLVELFIPKDHVNFTKEHEKIVEKQVKFLVPLVLWPFMQAATLLYCCHLALREEVLPFEFCGIMLSVGLVSGLGINVAHELGHKRSVFERSLALACLALTNYMHFQIEHVIGHHHNVATPKDPASSRLNESLFAFLPRTVVGSYISAWEIEIARLRGQGKSWLSPSNQMIWYLAIPAGIAYGMEHFIGAGAAKFFILQGISGGIYLEIVNYVEHYGLSRIEDSSGKYERVRPIHSWNACDSLTNYLLFKLQRHSDHHAYPYRRYQILRSFDESPNLPAGYPTMILLALCPPLWYRVMNPLVEDLKHNLQKWNSDIRA